MQHRVWEETEKEGSSNLCVLQNSVLTFPVPSLSLWSQCTISRSWMLSMNHRLQHGKWEDTEESHGADLCVLQTSVLDVLLPGERAGSWLRFKSWNSIHETTRWKIERCPAFLNVRLPKKKPAATLAPRARVPELKRPMLTVTSTESRRRVCCRLKGWLSARMFPSSVHVLWYQR